MKIYTKKGDSGKTDLFGISKRISKSSIRVSTYGEIDELNSFIGLIRATANSVYKLNNSLSFVTTFRCLATLIVKLLPKIFSNF